MSGVANQEGMKRALNLALIFIKNSIAVNEGRGSSHSHSYWLNQGEGWAPSYPETTGYLIPTLIRAAYQTGDEELLNFAESCADWLVEIQSSDGWFYSGIDEKNGPSVFNSAMILHGLTAALREFHKPAYEAALSSTINWLLGVQEYDGRFLRYAYSHEFQPAYYTRVVWALLDANSMLMNSELEASAVKLARSLSKHFSDHGLFNAGFHPHKPAFLHTIAYAFRGAIECGKHFSEPLDHFNLGGLYKIIEDVKRKGRWPGAISNDGVPDYSFRCLTGEAQMSVLLSRMPIPENDLALHTVRTLITEQKQYGWARGGIAGSNPFYGPYMRLRYPVWAAKFFTDSILSLSQDDHAPPTFLRNMG